MYLLSAHNTAKGYRQIVQDNGIDLSRKPNIPDDVRADPMNNMGWKYKADHEAKRIAAARRALEAQKKLVDAQRSEADAMIQKANEAMSRLREMERTVAKAPHRPTIRQIEIRICRAFKFSSAELRSNRRHKRIVLARQAVMYWAYRQTLLSLPEIGRRMGGRDHTTVLHAVRSYPAKRAEMGRNLRRPR